MGLLSNGKCKSKARMDGKTAVVTGANTGIGYETAKDLLSRGCRVVLACRNVEKAEAAATKLRGEVESAQVRVVRLDLASLQSVQQCAQQLIDSEPSIHLLINNAGIVHAPYEETEDGYEMTFQSNHLGHFLLTVLLLNRIKDSAPSRIVNISSLAHSYAKINFKDLQLTKSYDGTVAYGQSKLCNVLFTLELQQKLAGTGVVSYSVHPGVVSTDIIDKLPACFAFVMTHSRFLMKSPKDGAQTTLHCALDEGLAEQKGLYYSDCKEVKASSKGRNKEDAARLWQVSEELVDRFLR